MSKSYFRGGASHIAVDDMSGFVAQAWSESLSDACTVSGLVTAYEVAESSDRSKALLHLTVSGVKHDGSSGSEIRFISAAKVIDLVNAQNPPFGRIVSVSAPHLFGQLRHYESFTLWGYGDFVRYDESQSCFSIGRNYEANVSSLGDWGLAQLPNTSFGFDILIWVNVAR